MSDRNKYCSVGHPEVLEGVNGWLFLKEGTNYSYSYLTGVIPVVPEISHRWRSALQERSSLGVPVVHLICPEKLAVFPDRLPGTVLDNARLAIEFSSHENIIYPVNDLRNDIDGLSTYSRTDTHFNDAGALLCARKVVKSFGLKWDFQEEWVTREIIGDLGIKCSPERSSTSLLLKNRWYVRIADNGLRNRGRICYFNNMCAPFGRLLLFGDSFCGQNLAFIFSGVFKEVLFIHSLSTDYRIISKYRPDYIVYELAERFLRVAPQDGIDITSLLIPKLKTPERDKLLAWYRDEEHPAWRYVNRDSADMYLRS
jgi:alginate O-acetyltransferase complex protein AlgJ